MGKKKAFIRHEILNSITMINFMISDARIDSGQQSDILAQLKMITLLVANENFILKGKAKFFDQSFELTEIFEILSAILKAELKQKKVTLKIPVIGMNVFGDRTVIKNALEATLRKLISIDVKKIQIELNPKKYSIKIAYDSKIKIEMTKKPFIEYLEEKSDYINAAFQLGVLLMKANGHKINFKKNRIEIYFGKAGLSG